MKKGRNRRHRQARDFKRKTFVFDGFETENEKTICDECKTNPHQHWCFAKSYED